MPQAPRKQVGVQAEMVYICLSTLETWQTPEPTSFRMILVEHQQLEMALLAYLPLVITFLFLKLLVAAAMMVTLVSLLFLHIKSDSRLQL